MQGIPLIMSGRDIIIHSETGSGKTLTYVLPLLKLLQQIPVSTPETGPVALIIAPLVTLTRGMHWSMIVLAAALAGLIWWLGLSPVLILAAGAGAGIVWELSIAKKSKQ